jgi:hypothetical protein
VSDAADPSLRCSQVIRAAGVDPVGSAGTYDGYLLLEWPLPWPRDLSEVPELEPVHDALAGTGMRFQGLVPIFGDGEARRIIRYRRPPGDGFAGYERAERLVPQDRVVEAAVELASDGDGDPEWARAAITDDVLVCTHGKRDICCGSQGTTLVLELSADPARFGGSIRLWRTSHTGGHRFAPTGIVLPQGTVWAYLDSDALRRIVGRHGPLEDLLPRYRGCPGVGPPPVQAVEREAFAEIGWEWLDWRRWGQVDPNADDGTVTVVGESPTGERRTWTAEVEIARLVPVPECGLPLSAAKKSEPELRVRGLVRS